MTMSILTTGMPRHVQVCPLKVPLSMGGSGPHLKHSSLPHSESTAQKACWPVQPFLAGFNGIRKTILWAMRCHQSKSTYIFFSPRYSIFVARPKSAIFTCMASLMSMLPSLRSRCTTCRLWMYWQPLINWLMKKRTSGSVSVCRVFSTSTND